MGPGLVRPVHADLNIGESRFIPDGVVSQYQEKKPSNTHMKAQQGTPLGSRAVTNLSGQEGQMT